MARETLDLLLRRMGVEPDAPAPALTPERAVTVLNLWRDLRRVRDDFAAYLDASTACGRNVLPYERDAAKLIIGMAGEVLSTFRDDEVAAAEELVARIEGRDLGPLEEEE
jgi:hypothetical protein